MDIPDDVRVVIELFEKQLAKVSFPEVDASVLRRQAEELQAEATKVDKARAALEAALAANDSKLATLRDTAKRAIAYARIYSESHPDRAGLATALAELTAPSSNAAVLSAKRRGRPRKQEVQLFAMPDEVPETLAV
jgi:hypothetical protein